MGLDGLLGYVMDPTYTQITCPVVAVQGSDIGKGIGRGAVKRGVQDRVMAVEVEQPRLQLQQRVARVVTKHTV